MAAPFTAIRWVLTCAVGLTAASLAAPPQARPAPVTLHSALVGVQSGDKNAPPVIARYEMDEGGQFILDRSTPRPLMKFEDNPEIWVLQPAPGPRGDTVYRNDLGETMLRATRVGGMTVFTDRRPEGSAAALDGASSPLRIATLSPQALFNRFYQASVRSTRAAQHPVPFATAQDADPSSAAVLADAALVTSEALVDMSSHPENKPLLARIAQVVIAQGPVAGAVLKKGVLIVTIVPAQGVIGRPSSRRIEKAAGAK